MIRSKLPGSVQSEGYDSSQMQELESLVPLVEQEEWSELLSYIIFINSNGFFRSSSFYKLNCYIVLINILWTIGQ